MKALMLLPAISILSLLAFSPGDIGVRQIHLPEPSPCFTPEQWFELRADTEQTVALLRAHAILPPPIPFGGALFEWPLRPATGFEDYGYHAISGFPDHDDDSAGSVLDYQCGERTYDGHNGTDYVLWPFWWYKMDHAEIEIVAAAGGVIIRRDDGYDDRSCTPGGSTNKVAIRHADGTMAWYLHMKKWSVTSKVIGDTVATGEYLGIVGSSGNSALPHLHFDLRDENWITFDPHEGPCNDMAGGSWWVDQRPYFDCYVNAVRTHSAPPEYPPCPQQEIPHYQDRFTHGNTVYFGIYHRDILSGQIVHYAVLRPDGSIATEGTYSITDPHYAAASALGSYQLPKTAPIGTWKIAVDYESLRYEWPFTVYLTVDTTGRPGKKK